MRHAWLIALLVACGDNSAAPVDAARGPQGDGSLDVPADASGPYPTLFDTGLCVDRACTQITAGIVEYAPNFALWADAASKRRWYSLPAGTTIDTTDMDHWVFPQGMRIWKEFSVGSAKIETRYIEKTGPGNTTADWFYMAYQWDAAEDDTIEVPFGVTNANGTSHDIPSQFVCTGCHENLVPTRLLGFGAIQLDGASPLSLQDLIDQNALSAPPTGAAPYFPVPGNATVKAALGYLHANCGHCHNPTSQVYISVGVTMQLRLTVDSLAAATDTPPYQTAVGATATQPIDSLTEIIVPGDPSMSLMIDRFETANPATHMPALGSKMMDPTGDATLRAWITAL